MRLFWRKSSSRFIIVAGSTRMIKESLNSHGRLPFLHSHKDSSYLYSSGCMAAPILNHEIGRWRKDVLEGHDPFLFIFFLHFFYFTFLLLFAFETSWEVLFFSDGGSRDRDIILRDRTYLVFIFVSLAVRWGFRHAKLKARGEARARILAWLILIEFVCFFLYFFLSFFSFFFLPAFGIFHDQTNVLTQTLGEMRRDAERPKGDREQFASLDLWITD